MARALKFFDKHRHEWPVQEYTNSLAWVAWLAVLVTSYALLFSGTQLFNLAHDDAVGVFAGKADRYAAYYGEIASRHGIFETLFRHIAADVSIQTVRLIVVLIGVAPAVLTTFFVATRVFGSGVFAAAMASTLPLLSLNQQAIPYSFNSSYTLFDLLFINALFILSLHMKDQKRPEVLFVGIALMALVISEAISNAPFLTPALLILIFLERWRSRVAKVVAIGVVIGFTVKVFLEILQNRMASTPGSTSSFGEANLLQQLAANFVTVTDSAIGLGALGSALVFLGLALLGMATLLRWMRTRDTRVLVAYFVPLSLIVVPLLGFTVSTTAFQPRYGFYSHVGLFLLLGLILHLVVSVLGGVREHTGDTPNRADGPANPIRSSLPSAVSIIVMSVVLVSAYNKSQPTQFAAEITAQLERYSVHFQGVPTDAIRTGRTSQYLVLTDDNPVRGNILPLANAFGYVRLVTSNPNAFGWIGPVDGCGDPFGTEWTFWGRDRLPAALSDEEPLWAVGAHGRFGSVKDLEYLLATQGRTPGEDMGDARWRLYAIGDHAPRKLASGQGEAEALRAMGEAGVMPHNVGLNCGLAGKAAIPIAQEGVLDTQDTALRWVSTGFGAATAQLVGSSLVLDTDTQAVSNVGLKAEPGAVFELAFTAEVTALATGVPVPQFRVGPIMRDTAGEVEQWWSPKFEQRTAVRDAVDAPVIVSGSRRVVASQSAATAHIAFRGPVGDNGELGRVTILNATLRRVQDE
jgi:hypothetical protein